MVGLVSPCGGALGVAGRFAEPGRPRFAVGDRRVGEGRGAVLDELAALGQGAVHVGCHRAGRFGDEAGDQAWCSAGASGAGGLCGRGGEAGV